MSTKRRKTESKTEDEEAEEEKKLLLVDRKNSLDAVHDGSRKLAQIRKQSVSSRLNHTKADIEKNKMVDVDPFNPLKSLSRTHTFASNAIVELFEQRLGQLEYAKDQIIRHPHMKTHYNASHINVLVEQKPSDLRSIVKTLTTTIGRKPSAILVKEPSGRMDLIFDTRPSSDYCCCSIEPHGATREKLTTTDLDTNIATILSLKNRVISMDELSELFKDGTKLNNGAASTAKPAMGLAALRSSSLFTPLVSDTGTADAFDKLFMRKLFTYTEMFQCTSMHLDMISPSGHSICRNDIVFTNV